MASLFYCKTPLNASLTPLKASQDIFHSFLEFIFNSLFNVYVLSQCLGLDHWYRMLPRVSWDPGVDVEERGTERVR